MQPYANAIASVNPENADDASLIDRCRHGDPEAFSLLVTRYQDRIFNLVYRMIGSREDAADLCQETFVKAFRAITTFEARSQFLTWLYRIAANTCISFRRSQAGKSSQERTCDCDMDALGEDSASRPAAASDPTQHAVQRERAEAVQNAILKLDDESRVIVVFRDIEGKSYEEIAEILSCPLGTVRSRLHRARMELKEHLKRWL